MKRAKIHIGEVFASHEPAVVETLLGSCVAVCLHDRVNRIGGMNHILLPGRTDLSRFDNGARYGINAMELLINELMKLGAIRHKLVAKMFGGASILQAMNARNTPGEQNVSFVREFLQMEQIHLLSFDVGGVNPRRVYFYTETGEAFVKALPPLTQVSPVLREEDEYQRIVRKEMLKSSKVDLFR